MNTTDYCECHTDKILRKGDSGSPLMSGNTVYGVLIAGEPEPTGISLIFLSHPELNAVEIGKRLGISQGLMTQYVNGTKKPSAECEREILQEIKNTANELQLVCV